MLPAMAEVALSAAPGRPLTERLFDAVRLPPFALAAGAAVALGGFFLLVEDLSGRLARAERPDASPQLLQDIRIALVLLVCAVYAPAAYVHAVRHARRTWSQLAPHLRGAAVEREVLVAQAGGYDASALRRAGFVGVVLAMFLQALTDWNLRESFYLPALEFEALLHRLLLLVLAWWTARFVYATRVEARRLSRAGRNLLRIDLLDASATGPLVRHGFRSALLTLGFLTLMLPIAYDVQAARGLWATLLVLMPTATLVAGSLLLAPLRGVHAALSEAKRAELAWCHAEIRRRRERLAAGEAGGAGLADLVVYTQHVESVREWPIDVSTAVRFALALGLPLGSWLGGALVERLVTALLG